MTDIEPGWYKDPADPSTQRYWDGEGWLGDPISADVDPPAGPPTLPAPTAPSSVGARAGAPADDPEPTDPDATILGPLPPVRAPLRGAAAGRPAQQPATRLEQPTRLGRPTRPGLPPGAPGLTRRPANPPGGFVLATPGTRFAARIVDILAVLVLGAAANWLFAYRWWHSFWTYANHVAQLNPQPGAALPPVPDDITNLGLIITVVLTAVWFAYEVPSSANSGQTLGKRLLGIKVMRLESEERLGFGRSFRRWSRLGLPTLLWWCCGIGLVIQLLDCFSVAIDQPLHQALHDKGAATVVVRADRPTKDPTRVGVGGDDDRSDPPKS